MSPLHTAARRAAFIVALLTASLRPLPVFADEAECNSAYTDVQLLRRESKLLAAQARAIRCGQDQCGVTVRTDCARWLEEVERALPSLIVKAQDESGSDLVDVTVRAGNEILVKRLQSRPLVLDPGEYSLSFEYSNSTVERHVVIHEGEKYRILDVRFPSRSSSEPVEERKAAPRPPAAPPHKHSIPAASYALTALAGVAGAVFIGLATSGLRAEKELRATCAETRSCSGHDVDSIRARYLGADVALGFGVLSLAGAGAVWLFAPATPNAAPARAALGGLGYTLSGSF